MPNYCDFTMEVQGNFRNVDAFVQIMNNNYDKIHMYRIFEATPTEYENYGFQRRVCISGYCAWSVMSCMLCENVMADRAFTIPKLRLPNEPSFSYYLATKLPLGSGYFARDLTEEILESDILNNFNGCTITQLARYYRLKINIYSTEPGMEFCELYKIDDRGNILVNKTDEYVQYWMDDRNFTFDQYCETYGFNKENLPFGEKEYNEALNSNDDLIYESDGLENEFHSQTFNFPENQMVNIVMIENVNKEKK